MDDTAQQSTVASSNGVGRQMEPPVQNRPAGQSKAPELKDDSVAPSVSRHPEQGPIATTAPMEESADIQIEASHPPVEVSAEMKDAGVEQGEDAQEHELPEEVKQIGAELAKEATPVTASSQMPPTHVDKSYEELLVAAKAAKSPQDASSWNLREMIRAWKKKLFAETGEVPKS